MLPETDYDEYNLDDEIDNDYDEISYANKTYYLDVKNKRIAGTCDEDEALCQAVYKILNTELGKNIIYDDDYGIEKDDLLGDDMVYTESEIKVRIQEAILSDDRFSSVEDFKTSRNKGKLSVSFTVYTTDNEALEVEEGVELDV